MKKIKSVILCAAVGLMATFALTPSYAQSASTCNIGTLSGAQCWVQTYLYGTLGVKTKINYPADFEAKVKKIALMPSAATRNAAIAALAQDVITLNRTTLSQVSNLQIGQLATSVTSKLSATQLMFLRQLLSVQRVAVINRLTAAMGITAKSTIADLVSKAMAANKGLGGAAVTPL